MGANRNRAAINDDFPAPVRPTIPTFCFASIVKVRFFKTCPSALEYLRYNLSNVIAPSDGHDFGGILSGGEINGGSCSTFVNSKTLSTEVIWFSNSVD